MRRKRGMFLSLATFILGEGVGSGLQMTDIVNPLVGWAIMVLSLLVALVLFVVALRSKPDDSSVSGGEKERVIAFRQEYIEKRHIPDKLLAMDMYLLEVVSNQDLTLCNLQNVVKHVWHWHYCLPLLFIGLTYRIPFMRRFLSGTYRNFILRFALRWNLALKLYGLGTLSVIEGDKYYKEMYHDLLALESGLPDKIVARIHRNVGLCPNLISMKLLRTENQFWDELPENANRQLLKLLNLIRNSIGVLTLPVDGVLTRLRSEISADIEDYFAKGE